MANTLAARLEEMGIHGPLVDAAKQGRLTELVCAMDECLCPKGRGYFDPRTQPLTDWALNEDHFPELKMKGGLRSIENLRLAHVLCNRVDFARTHKKKHTKDRNKALEGALREHPNVLEAAVIVRTKSNERPLAALVLRPGTRLTRDGVMVFLKNRGANPKLPDEVAFLDEIPRTAEGKVVKRELRDKFEG